jgi:hypothetical protein
MTHHDLQRPRRTALAGFLVLAWQARCRSYPAQCAEDGQHAD